MEHVTPFFPAWRPRLAALGQRTRRTLHSLHQATLAQLQEHLRGCLPPEVFAPEAQGAASRERVFSLRLTLECFLWQMLKPRTACREVVRQVQALLTLQGKARIDESDSAYVQARQRLPRARLEQALGATAEAAERRVGRAAGGRLGGRPVKVVDGSSTQLADTPRNQQAYPQPSTQKRGCGFPVMKVLVFFSLASGVILRAGTGNLHQHDLRLLRALWGELTEGDVLLGDRSFGEYGTLATLPRRGVDVVARLHQARKVDFRKGRRLGRRDALFAWKRGSKCSALFSPEEWAASPAQITVRLVRFSATIRGHRSRQITLVTTLLDARHYPAPELMALYLRRWRLELCLRDLKTTLGMEQLRCKTPEMAEKELLAYLVAHNLVRVVMAAAVARHGGELERVSFKGSVDALRQYSEAISRAPNRQIRRRLWDGLLLDLARDLVPHRPGRSEPRATKRRPKPFPLLNRPRRQYKEVPHRNRYWKARRRNHRGLN